MGHAHASLSTAGFERYCEETPIVTRIHLITGACLLSTGLVMGSLNGGIAAAEPDGQASSDSSRSSGDSGGDSKNTSTTGDSASDSASASEGDTGSTDPDDDEAGTSLGDLEDAQTRSPSFAQSNAPDDTPSTDTGASFTEEVIGVPAPATSGGSSDSSEPKSSSSDTAATAPTSTVQTAAEPTVHVAASPGTPQAAADPAPAPAPAPPPPTAPVQGPPTPAATTPAPAVASIATPGLGAAVAYLLSTLVATALDVVTAVIQMVTDLRATLGMPWAGPAGGDARLPSAFSPENSIVLVLKRILSRSLSPERSSSTLSSALAAGMSLGKILALTSSLQPAALTLAESRGSDGTHHTPAQGVVTALAAMSLWALLSAALPGLSGLLAAGVAGVRLGYRQARARMALHTMELTPYVRAGPIGIVRTGSVVSVYARTAPVAHPPAERHLRLAS